MILQILGAYEKYIIDVGRLLGGDNMHKVAKEIIDFETQLAKV